MNSNSANNIAYRSFSAEMTGARKVRIGALDVLVFFVPTTQFIQLAVVGQLFMPDIILAAILPFLLRDRGRRLLVGLPKMFIILSLLWLAGQILTDVIQDSAFVDYSRGWAKIGFTIINFMSLYLLLYGNKRRLFLYMAGLAAGSLITYFVNPNIRAEYYPWKFGYGEPVTLLLILMAMTMSKGSRLGLVIGMLFGIAGLNLTMGTRSDGLIVFLTACYLYAQAKWGSRVGRGRIRLRQYLLAFIVIVFAVLAMTWIYSYSASSGLLGVEELRKYEIQSQGKYGLLIGGRGEILVSSIAIIDSPVFGHGSWAKDCHYVLLLSELKEDADYVAGGGNDFSSEVCLIPSHSHLFGAWVEAGILGAAFWAWVLSLPSRILLKPRRTTGPFTSLAVFGALTLIWTILFSPYGADGRFVTTYYVVVMMTYLTAQGGATTKSIKPM